MLYCRLTNAAGKPIDAVKALEGLLANVFRNGDTIVFRGLNVQIVNGADSTDGDANGLGNLIVGYNEQRGDGAWCRCGLARSRTPIRPMPRRG